LIVYDIMDQPSGLMQAAISLVESGRDIDEVGGPYKNTLLHEAADNNTNDVVKYLVGHGADINKRNINGNTPFHYYVLNRPDIYIVEFLLDNGANKYRIDSSGETVANRARRGGNSKIAKFIESYSDVPVKGVHCDDS